MTANTSPIFSLIPRNTISKITAADTSLDATGANVVLAHTANATDGGWVEKITLKSNTANATAVATIRIFLNNGSTVATATNNALIYEFVVPAVTATSTNTTINFEFPIRLQLAPGYRLYIAAAAMNASTGWSVVTWAGDYS